ncbi:MAG: DUF2062 domain-containing protein [Proteobacteria bacterium]|nr:DUF2062 domain-containing protein [Pseudomonadota bacterium]MDA1324538.1 DUF2062 domain-containing protein [Pseudomonadota bacterium]
MKANEGIYHGLAMNTSDNQNNAPRSNGRNGRNNRSWWDRLGRNIRYRLFIPLRRGIHPAEHSARGVAVGLAWGLTPTIGIQMPLAFFTWVIARYLFKWNFSLILAVAWTWTTNFVTLVPCYFLFYVTGQIMLGRFDDLSGYKEFEKLLASMMVNDSAMGYLELIWAYTVAIYKAWGWPLVIGCLPWSFLGTWAGYVLSLRFITGHRANKAKRRAARLTAGKANS